MRKRKWRGMSIEAERELRKLVQHEGFRNSVKIRDHLEAEFPGQIPSERTIRQYVKALVPPDLSGAWSLEDDSEDPAFLLAVLGEQVERTHGRTAQLTRKEAEWVERIKRALPDIPPMAAFSFARHYMLCESEGWGTAHLDMALALTPRAGGPTDHEIERERIARHVEIHDRLWTGLPLIAWARESWAADEYEKAALSQGATAIITDFASMREDAGETVEAWFGGRV